jgi:hypothetical protein
MISDTEPTGVSVMSVTKVSAFSVLSLTPHIPTCIQTRTQTVTLNLNTKTQLELEPFGPYFELQFWLVACLVESMHSS